MGAITELAASAPGYSSIRPKSAAPLAMTLKLNGYSTAQFGKCHEVPVWQTSPAGPYDSWPTGGGGFEYFYGFIGGEANQWYPTLYEGTTPVELKKTPQQGYHLVDDMTESEMHKLELMRKQDRIEEDLKAPIESIFTSFDDRPVAAASIAQVHRATLPGGTTAVQSGSSTMAGPAIVPRWASAWCSPMPATRLKRW